MQLSWRRKVSKLVVLSYYFIADLKSTYFVKQPPISYFRNVHYLFQLDWRLWLQINISSLRHIVFCVLRRQFWVWTRNTWSDTSVCWDLRQMLWKCLWIGPHFSYGQGNCYWQVDRIAMFYIVLLSLPWPLKIVAVSVPQSWLKSRMWVS